MQFLLGAFHLVAVNREREKERERERDAGEGGKRERDRKMESLSRTHAASY